MNYTVGVGDLKIAYGEGDVLVTHALGSCIGLTAYDPAKRIGGMLHFMLPVSQPGSARASENPYIFADTGIPLLFKGLYEYGADKSRLVVKAAGGANILNDNGMFAIGKRNYVILKKILWKNKVLIEKECIGGTSYRTMYLDVSTGKTWLKTKDGKIDL